MPVSVFVCVPKANYVVCIKIKHMHDTRKRPTLVVLPRRFRRRFRSDGMSDGPPPAPPAGQPPAPAEEGGLGGSAHTRAPTPPAFSTVRSRSAYDPSPDGQLTAPLTSPRPW